MLFRSATLISRPVQDWITAIENANEVTAGLDPRGRYCLFIGNVTLNGVNYNNVILRYDILVEAMLQDGGHIPMDAAMTDFRMFRDGGAYRAWYKLG